MTTQIVFDDRGKVYRRTPEPGHVASHVATAMILRATAIVLLMSVAVIHIVQLVPTFKATPALGVTFVLLIAGAVLVGGWLVKDRRTPFHLWLPVAGLGTAALVGYGFTRLFSTPLDRVDVGNWSCELGMAALFVEAVLVAIAAYAIALRPRGTEHPPPNTYSEIRINSNGHAKGSRTVDVGGAPRSA
jgi:lysylphosphatidylglycerol synthetase-like protein (DUF2156 family)